MTERKKPPGMSQESWVDHLVREAEARGDFDHLPGKGKPIPDLKKPHDEFWWVKRLLERERLSITPATLALKREVEEAVGRIRRQTEEAEVRRIVAEVNEKIAEANRKATSGPASTLGPLDADEVVKGWRKRR